MRKSYIILILIFKIRIFFTLLQNKLHDRYLQMFLVFTPRKQIRVLLNCAFNRPRSLYALLRKRRENSIAHGMYASRVCKSMRVRTNTYVRGGCTFIHAYVVVLAILFHTSLAPGTKGWLPRSCIAAQQRVYTWRAHLSPFHPSATVRAIESEAVCQISSQLEIFAFCSVPNTTISHPECPRCNYDDTL